jgi:hypothetical protein
MSQKHPLSKQLAESEPTASEILQAINDFSSQIEERFTTKADLKSALQNYPTKQNLATALQNYPTKQDLATALQNYPTKQDLANDLKLLEDTLVTKLDRILVNTERLETERVAHVAWLQRHDEQFKKLMPQA